MTNGGYDDGYRQCPCFWGSEPGSYVRLLCEQIASIDGLRILDAGCGEGKNAAFLAERGGIVEAVDISELAVRNGQRHWKSKAYVNWLRADIRHIKLQREYYDIVIAYGLLHCLHTIDELQTVLRRLQAATRPHGYNVVCAFNARHQDLRAHSDFVPVLLSHSEYKRFYAVGWDILAESDSDLIERHPHNNIEHTHSMTRIVARKTLS
jgi:tellurite methyltransferase